MIFVWYTKVLSTSIIFVAHQKLLILNSEDSEKLNEIVRHSDKIGI